MNQEFDALYIGYFEKNLPNRRYAITHNVRHETGTYYVNVQYSPGDYVLRVIRFFHKFQAESEKASMCSIYSAYMTEMLQKYPNPTDGLKELQSRELRRADGTASTIVGHLADHLINDYYFEKEPS